MLIYSGLRQIFQEAPNSLEAGTPLPRAPRASGEVHEGFFGISSCGGLGARAFVVGIYRAAAG